MFRPDKIISGGQTGADIGGLVGAKRVGIKTGGTAPRGYKTEKGSQEEVLKSFGLVMHRSPSYKERTHENVLNSNATMIFSRDSKSRGTELTMKYCEAEERPYCLLERLDERDFKIAEIFLANGMPKVLNIAGNRESLSPGIASEVAKFIEKLFAKKE